MKKIKCTLQVEKKTFTKDSKDIVFNDYVLVFPSGSKVAIQPKEWAKMTLKTEVFYAEEDKD